MLKGLLVCLLSAVPLLDASDAFHYRVARVRTMRNERGQLDISESGASYRSDNGKTAIQLPFSDIREADVSDPTKIRLETYHILKRRLTGRRVYAFQLREGRHDEGLARFLTERLARPVVGHYSIPDPPSF